MCLLIHKPASSEFKEEHLSDFYTRNRDGIGVMYAEDNMLYSYKLLPKTVQDVLDFYEQYAKGRECAIHYRMRTHGEIDYENCHPYPVFGFDGEEHPMPTLLMHNGVLHTGNSADTSKSDTWHYIRDYLRKLLGGDPTLAFTPEFRDVIGKHIGNNRFILMNHLGEVSVINKAQGVEFQGAWLSNEYAWSAHKYLPTKTYTGGHYSRNGVYYPPSGKYSSTSLSSHNDNWTRNSGKAGTSTKKTAGGGGRKTTAGLTKRQIKALQREFGERWDQVASQPKPAPTTSPSSPGKTTAYTTNGSQLMLLPSAKAAKNEENGVSVECKWLDDILEMRSILDAFYVANQTSNKQLECMIEECGVEHVYFALELLGDGELSETGWDKLSSDRHAMRRYADTDLKEWATLFGASASALVEEQ